MEEPLKFERNLNITNGKLNSVLENDRVFTINTDGQNNMQGFGYDNPENIGRISMGTEKTGYKIASIMTIFQSLMIIT